MKKLADISLFESIENRSFGSSVFNEVNKPGFQEFDPEQDARSRLRGLSDLNADDVYDTIRHFAQQVHLGEITPDEARRYLRSVYGIDYRQINGFLRRYNLKKQMEEDAAVLPAHPDRPTGYRAPQPLDYRNRVYRTPKKKKIGFFSRINPFKNEKTNDWLFGLTPAEFGEILRRWKKDRWNVFDVKLPSFLRAASNRDSVTTGKGWKTVKEFYDKNNQKPTN